MKEQRWESMPSVTDMKMRSVYLYRASVKEVGGVKWGFINAKGRTILPAVYDHAGDFQEDGLAIVRMMDRDGVIDSNGYFIIKPKYETINPFFEGRATVIDRGAFKAIDEKGTEITHRPYAFIGDYKQGRARAAITNAQGYYVYGYLNRWGKEVIPLIYESGNDFIDGKTIVKIKKGEFALINLTGKIVHSYHYANVDAYGEGILSFQKEGNGKFGYMDEQGHVLITPRFSWAEPFINGKAIVNVSDDYKNLYGVIDKSGHFVVKPNYQSITSLGENRLAIGKALDPERPYLGSKYALADNDGHMLTGFLYNHISQFKEGFASASNNHYTFFIDRNGKRAEGLPTANGAGTLEFDRTVIRGEIDFRLFYFDKKGQLVWKQNDVIPLHGQYSIREKKYKPNKDYLVYYPEIQGVENAGVNSKLMALAGVKEVSVNEQLESNYVGDFEVPFFKKNLVVIEISGYDYPFGAAHGMPVKKYAHVDVATGQFYHLKDLFKAGSNYVKVLSEAIAEKIKNDKTYSYLFPGSFKGISQDQPFFITPDALNLYFAPYKIAPYAAGFPTFTVPFEDIEDILDTNGSFWRSFH